MKMAGTDGITISDFKPEHLIVNPKYLRVVTAQEIYDWTDLLFDVELLEGAQLPAEDSNGVQLWIASN